MASSSSPIITNNKPLWSSNLLSRVILGQFLACCIALTGLFSSLLASRDTSIALLQSTSAYLLIFLVAGPIHFHYSRKELEKKRIAHVVQTSSARSSHSQQQQQQQNHQNNTNNESLSSPGERSPTSSSETMNLITSSANTHHQSEVSKSTSCLQVGFPGIFQSHFPVWRYFALACCDVAASFFAIKAYSYTDITSAQLLDAATIFTVMILGYFFLKRRFGFRHLIGVLMALGGMVGLVFLDAAGDSRDSTKTAPNAVLGDILTLIASVLYGITNIGCESLLKSGRVEVPDCIKSCASKNNGSAGNEEIPPSQENNHTTADEASPDSSNSNNHDDNDEGSFEKLKEGFNLIIEYVSFISLFGFILSFILLLSLSYGEIVTASTKWDWKSTMFQVAFCCVMVASYIGLPSLLKLTNATFACLSLLTADLFAVVFDYITTGVAPKGLYYLCAFVILGGVLIFDTAEIEWKNMKRVLMCQKTEDENEDERDVQRV